MGGGRLTGHEVLHRSSNRRKRHLSGALAAKQQNRPDAGGRIGPSDVGAKGHNLISQPQSA
ncbi:hypothetical protein I603_1277 [Erythrobacter dokdonensis DSW-74]|uniref:Uncharacterized protein n=1 Tax=Erythrobacter dokdonensis DSW-74 TaxID=1300349 RepID=A0A1A7BH79_9SPHN|nr:hypothetical protein I603_1277 [Erythrobacter dokdonensis DSW-74]